MAEARLNGTRRLHAPLLWKWSIRLLVLLLLIVLALLGIPHLGRPVGLESVLSPGDPDGPPAILDERFSAVFETLTDVDFEVGTQAEVLLNGEGTFPRLFEDLRAARRSITIQMYYKSGGTVSDSVVRILAERAREGVQVFFMHDAFGSQSLPDRYADTLRAAGARVATFRAFRWYELDRIGHRSHVRAIVVDGRLGYTGGFGLDDKWLGNGRRPGEWRETNVRFLGPVVSKLQAVFAYEWSEATGDLLTSEVLFPSVEEGSSGSLRAGLLHSVPGAGPSPAARALALSIAGARRKLWISTAYFLPDATFRKLLVSARRRGVDVRILTNGSNTDIQLTRLAARGGYAELLSAGIRIFEYRPAMMHGKSYVVDGALLSVGTVNFDNRSLALNDEVSFLTLDADLAQGMEADFLEDLRFAREVELDVFLSRSVVEKLLERIAGLFLPLL